MGQFMKSLNMLSRKINFQDTENESVFLWGARQTGKSTLLKMLFPDVRYIDLLNGSCNFIVLTITSL